MMMKYNICKRIVFKKGAIKNVYAYNLRLGEMLNLYLDFYTFLSSYCIRFVTPNSVCVIKHLLICLF